jgi:tetratricopeptide (TPR) repeat protein
MRAFCVLVFILLAPGAGLTIAQTTEHLGQPGPAKASPVPFLFQRRAKPGRDFRKDQLEQWLDAVAKHHPGDVDDSARQVAALGPETLADMISAFEWNVVPFRDRDTKVEAIKRAAVLHTDIAAFAIEGGRLNEDKVNAVTQTSLHMGAAFELLQDLEHEELRPRKDPFILAWWRAVAALLGEHRDAGSSILFMERAVSRFPSDPDLLVMAGTLHELLASPLVQDDAMAGRELRDARGNEEENLRSAERLYREVLKIEPALAEARVRLGRVLARQQSYVSALSELRSVADGAASPKLRYYRDLFLGEAEEGLNGNDAAREAYRRALALYPGAQSAWLALASLERRAGNRSRALDAVLHLLTLPTGDEARQDPWRAYYVSAPAARAPEWLDEVRATFRRRP